MFVNGSDLLPLAITAAVAMVTGTGNLSSVPAEFPPDKSSCNTWAARQFFPFALSPGPGVIPPYPEPTATPGPGTRLSAVPAMAGCEVTAVVTASGRSEETESIRFDDLARPLEVIRRSTDQQELSRVVNSYGYYGLLESSTFLVGSTEASRVQQQSYDEFGRVASILLHDNTSGTTDVISRTYSADGRLRSVLYDHGRDGVVETRDIYEWDDAGLLDAIVTTEPPHENPYWVQRYLWHGRQLRGLLDYKCDRGLQGQVSYDYDEAGYPNEETSYVVGSELPDHRWLYTYSSGLLRKIYAEEYGNWHGTTTYSYDAHARIERETFESKNSAIRVDYMYDCDATEMVHYRDRLVFTRVDPHVAWPPAVGLDPTGRRLP